MIMPPTRYYRYSFSAETDKVTGLHPPFIYNAIKTARMGGAEEPQGPGETDRDRLVLDASWHQVSDQHSFSVTLDHGSGDIVDLVERSMEYWPGFFQARARIVEYGVEEIYLPRRIPRGVSHVLVTVISPLCCSLVDVGRRRYLRPEDLCDFSNLMLQAVRKYRDLFSDLPQATYRRITSFAHEVSCRANDTAYFAGFPLRADGSLRVTKSIEGSILYQAEKWMPEALHLLAMAEVTHLGQKAAYGLGGVRIEAMRSLSTEGRERP